MSNHQGPSQGTLLVELAVASSSEFVHTADGDAFVLTPVGDHIETLPLRGRGFGAWLRGRFFEDEEKAANAQAISDALGVLEQRALRGRCVSINTRLAAAPDGCTYLDLGGPDWRVAKIATTEWKVIPGAEAPIYFRRPGGLLALPEPERGGSVDDLRPFVNVANDDDWRLVAGWLVAAMRWRGPYPLLVLSGEQGCAKSTTARVLRRLIDPNRCDLRSEPRSEEDLILAASNGHVVTLDNVSSLPPWLSDGLCRLSTGGGIGKRKLYSDSDETILDAQRPIIINGIGDVVSRPDLLDRAFLVTLPRLADGARRREAVFWRDFTAAHPRILGALLDAVVVATRDEEVTEEKLGPLPRMMDASVWIEAASSALGWVFGAFVDSYSGNRSNAHELALEGSPVAEAMQKLVDLALVASPETKTETTSTELLDALAKHVSEAALRAKSWPSSPRALSAALQRLAPTLRAVGIDINHARQGKASTRLWCIESSRDLRRLRRLRRQVNDSDDLAADTADASADTADASAETSATMRRPVSPRNYRVADAADAADANSGPLSNGAAEDALTVGWQ